MPFEDEVVRVSMLAKEFVRPAAPRKRRRAESLALAAVDRRKKKLSKNPAEGYLLVSGKSFVCSPAATVMVNSLFTL